MTREEALQELTILTQANTEPKLTPEELNLCLKKNQSVDVAGLKPSETGWVPTYFMSSAAAMAWDLKASKAVCMHDFAADKQEFSSSQIYAHCKKQAAEFRKKICSSPELKNPAVIVTQSYGTTF
jgi:hypothetical protein